MGAYQTIISSVRKAFSNVITFTDNRRSLENPSTSLADPIAWMTEETQASSGVSISADKALTYAPWWRGINLISRDVAKLPLIVYRRSGAGKSKDTKHPAFRLLRFRANNDLVSAFMFKQTIQAHAMSWGNGYAWIVRDGLGTPREMLVLNPFDVVPFRLNGQLSYAVRAGTEWRRESPANILHIKGLSPDGLVGYSVYSKARDSLGEGMAAQQYGARFFKNNARPSVVIEIPGDMKAETQKNFLAQWDKMYGGLDSSHRTALITNGGKVNPFSTNARESQLEELRKFNLVDIANWIGVPVHKVGGEGRTAFASLEMENQAYLDESLDPWLVCWESECWEKLLTEEEKDRDTHVIEFMRQALVRADMVARYTAYNIAVRGGWMSPDMVASKENENPIPDGKGKNFFRAMELAIVEAEDDVAAGVVQDVQQTALNGAQIASLLSITQGVTSGTIPPESGEGMIEASFPTLTNAQIAAIIGPLKTFKVKPEEPVEQVPETDSEPDEPMDEIAQRMVMDATRRACRHLRIQAVRRAKLAGNFLNMIDDDRDADEARVGELVADVVSLCGGLYAAERTAADISRHIFDESKAVLLSAADAAHNRDELADAVEARMTELESTLPAEVATMLVRA